MVSVILYTDRRVEYEKCILFLWQELISFRDPHVMSSRLMVEKPERDVERVINTSLAEVIAGHLR